MTLTLSIVTSCGSVCGHLCVAAKYRLLFTPSHFGNVKCTSHVASPSITEVLPIAGTNPHIGYFTHSLTPQSRILLEKLTGSQLVKIFPAFYGTRRFITAFTSARRLSLSWAKSIQSIPPHPTSWRSILLSYHLHLGFPSCFFPSWFLTTTLYTPLLSPIGATCPPPISLFSI